MLKPFWHSAFSIWLGRPLDPVLRHFSRDGVPVQAQQVSSGAEIPSRPLKGARDEKLLELPTRVLVMDALVEHVADEPLQLIAHAAYTSARPLRRRNASTYFSRVRSTTASGSEGTGGCLFQRISSR